jgi:hypothetical protein
MVNKVLFFMLAPIIVLSISIFFLLHTFLSSVINFLEDIWASLRDRAYPEEKGSI